MLLGTCILLKCNQDFSKHCNLLIFSFWFIYARYCIVSHWVTVQSLDFSSLQSPKMHLPTAAYTYKIYKYAPCILMQHTKWFESHVISTVSSQAILQPCPTKFPSKKISVQTCTSRPWWLWTDGISSHLWLWTNACSHHVLLRLWADAVATHWLGLRA